MKSDLSKVRVGDKIWTIQQDLTEVLRIEDGATYPVITDGNSYTIDGKLVDSDKHPSAFLEYPFKDQPIEKDTLVYYRESEDGTWRVGYYSHFENGKHFCFNRSLKSYESGAFAPWNIVTTENPLI